MSKDKQFNINLTEKQIYELKMLGSLKGMTDKEFAEWLIEFHLDMSRDLVPFIKRTIEPQK